MKNIMYLLSILTLISCAAGSFQITRTARAATPIQSAAGTPQQHTGAYTTYRFSQRLAIERYTITSRPDGNTDAEADIELAGPPKARVTTLVSPVRPLSFSEERDGTNLLSAQYGADTVQVHAPGAPEVNVKSSASVVLENLVWHHYILLLSRYDRSKGGRQDLVASLPSAAKSFPISVDMKDSPAFDAGGRTIKTDHYILITGAKLQIEIWANESQIPLLILVEAQGLKVIHEGYDKLAEGILASREEAAGQAVAFSKEEVSFKNGDITLAGTISIPQDKASRHPAVIVISGSGSQNRDGNPGGFFMFKLIAEQLASHGIAVLRHDDRGAGKSSMITRAATYQDFIDDTKAAINYLRSRPDIDPEKIALAGHSEGGFTASIIAAGDPKIAAIALLAGGALANFEDLLNEQVLYDLALQRQIDPSDHSLEQPIVQMLRRQISEARAGLPDVRLTDGHEYFRQHLALNMPDIYGRVHCPVLILQGERDGNVLALHAIQVALKFSELGNKSVKVRIIPNVDHAFVPSPLDTCATDTQRGQVSPEFLTSLERWMTSVLMSRKN